MDTYQGEKLIYRLYNNKILRVKEFEGALYALLCDESFITQEEHRVICVRENVHLKVIM